MRRISIAMTAAVLLAVLVALPVGVAAQPTTSAKPANFTTLPITAGANQSVVVGDVTNLPGNPGDHPSGPACFVGDQTPQNETTISIDPTNPNNLIGGANDYRFFVESEQRYDGSAAAYVSHDGGVTWALFSFQPKGKTGLGNYEASPIVFSKSTDGGATWTEPELISDRFAQFSTPVVYDDGTPDGVLYVSYEVWNNPVGRSGGRAFVSRSEDGGDTWTHHFVSNVNDLPSPLPHSAFRDASYPVLEVGDDGTLHMVWSNWQGGSADIVYSRSQDAGASWTRPVRINQESVKSDQFFAWIDSSGGFVHVGFVDRQYTDDAMLDHSYVVSPDGGDTWSQTVRVSSASSPSDASGFGANCAGEFIGDYTGITAVGGTAHLLWMDGRPGTQPPSPSGDTTDQDAFYARLTVGP